MSGTRVMTAVVPLELAEKVEALAATMARSPDAIVEEALADWLAFADWKHQATLEGLADISTGRVVDHARVVEWVNSLGTDHPLPMPEPLATAEV